MKFSMNGFRRQLSNDVSKLSELVEDVLRGDHYDEDDLVEAMNDVITHSNLINCVYSEGDEHFDDMSELEVEHIELKPVAEEIDEED